MLHVPNHQARHNQIYSDLVAINGNGNQFRQVTHMTMMFVMTLVQQQSGVVPTLDHIMFRNKIYISMPNPAMLSVDTPERAHRQRIRHVGSLFRTN